MPQFPINADGVALLKDFESWRGTAYLCPAGVWTIGWGFTRGVYPNTTMTPEEGEQRLAVELGEYVDAVLGACTRVPNGNQLAAMVCLAWNIGIAGFRKSTVLRCHNAGDFDAAARAFSLWNKARVGGVLQPVRGLIRRRAAEAALYLKPDRVAVAYPAPALAPIETTQVGMPVVEYPPVEDLMPQRIEPERPLTQSHIVRASSLSGGVAGLTLAAEGARAVGDIKYSLGDWLPYIALALIVGAAGWAIWERVRQRKRGEA